MLIYSFITDYQAFSLRYKDNTTRDKNETKVGKQSANLGKNNEPIQNRLSFLIDCKSVILHHLTILSFPMVRPAWDNWWLLVCAVIYIFSRDRLQYLLPAWGAFILICLLGTPLREGFGGEAILAFPERNFYQGMLSILHIGNGALPAFTMGGVILSILSARYAGKGDGWKLRNGLTVAVLLLLVGIGTHHFWIVAKMGGTPPWVFYVTAISVGLYTLLGYLVSHQVTGWFNLIRPAGTATLTTYLVPYVFYGFADVTGVVLPDWFTHGFMGLVNCLCFAFVVIGVTWVMEKLHVKLKI